MAELRRFAREVLAQLRLARRNPFSVLFTVALPLLLVPLLHSLHKGTPIFLGSAVSGVPVPADQYFVPAVAAFAVASACFGQLAVRVAIAREQGVLKRLRGTPASLVTNLAARIVAPLIVALIVVAAALALGASAYDLTVPTRSIVPAIAITLLGGAMCSALGLVTTRLATTADAAPAVVYAVLIPVAFVSSTFFAPYLAPEWMHDLGAWLPLQPFISALGAVLSPTATGFGASAWDVGRMAAWGVGGAVVATLAFEWSPAAERPPRDLVVTLGMAGAAAVAITAIVVIGGRHGPIQTGVRVGSLQLGVPTLVDLIVDLPDDQLGPFPMSIEVVRGSNDLRAFKASSACGIMRAADVDPGWLAAIASRPRSAALVDLCGAVAFTADGRCIAPCSGALARLKTHVGSDGRISIDRAPRQPSLGYPDRSALVPYLLADGKPAAVSESVGELAIGATDLRLRIGTNAGGTIDSVHVDDPTIGKVDGLQLGGVRWLSLPIGGTDAKGDSRSSHPSPGRWVVESPRGRLELEATGRVLGWDELRILLALDAGSYQRELVLRKP